MAHLITVGRRVVNLDQLIFAEFGREHDRDKLVLYFEPSRKWQADTSPGLLSRHAPQETSMNMSFIGKNARYVWDKLTADAETWTIPGDHDPDPHNEWQTLPQAH